MKTITLILSLIITSAAWAFNFASPSEPSARVVLDHSVVSKQLFPVRLLTVNDENVSMRDGTVWLSPGEYKLQFGTTVDTAYTKQTAGLNNRRDVSESTNTLNLTVEADKTYYVAFDASSAQSEEWQPVVYKVK